MGSQVAPDLVYDHQGICYSVAPDCYGFYSTGNEKPGEWEGQHSFLGSDGQDIRYSGLQAESLPYVYYSPSYDGYTHSSYNPFNPYIPGAVMDLDGANLGVQQYCTDQSYQQPTSSSSFIPVVVPPSTDIVPYATSDPSFLGLIPSFARSYENEGMSFMSPLPPIMKTSASVGVVTENPSLEFPKFAPGLISDEPLVNVQQRKQLIHRAAVAGSVPQTIENAHSAGFLQAPGFSNGRVLSAQQSSKANLALKNYLSYESTMSPSTYKFSPKFSALSYGSRFRNPNFPNDLNRGPRVNRANDQGGFITAKSYTSKLNGSSLYKNITIEPDHYDGKDFRVDYPNGKFFVIKSYSEDDVHKSIKYNVWSSTPNGNKKLDSAHLEAQNEKCPVFLFFSVNASRHFCGIAEMIGRVDFEHDMDFWQQDQWAGSFPIKWHIIKDVPNSSLRHIILENNENRPVTHSRDTQEIAYTPGIAMLSIFKNNSLKESMLDDFVYYEEMEKLKHQVKIKLPRRNYGSTDLIPTFVPAKKMGSRIIQPIPSDILKPSYSPNQLPGDNMNQLNGDLSEANKKDQVGRLGQHLEGDTMPKTLAFTKHSNRKDRQLVGEVTKSEKLDRRQPSKFCKLDSAVGQSLDVVAKLENCKLSLPSKPDGPQLSDVVFPSSASNMNQVSVVGHNRNIDGRKINRTFVKSQKTHGKAYRPVRRHEVQPNCNGIYPSSETDQSKSGVPSSSAGDSKGNAAIVLPNKESEKRNTVTSVANAEAKINNLLDPKCSVIDAPENKKGNPKGHAIFLPESQENGNTKSSSDPLTKQIAKSSVGSSNSSVTSDTVTIGLVQIKLKI